MTAVHLQTERLKLVPEETAFLETAYAIASDQEANRLMLYMPVASKTEVYDYLKLAEDEWKSPLEEQVRFYFAILLDGKHIGEISIDIIDDGVGEFGWILQKDYWRRGIVSEAALALLDFARDTLHLKRMVAHCDTENVGSYRVMEKLGMRRVAEYGGRRNRLAPEEERRELRYELEFP
jgi:RimJ/RimL family protein N-acetyltransferase